MMTSKFSRRVFLSICAVAFSVVSLAQNGTLVFQSDFGLKDGAVSAMKGVSISVSPQLRIFDITHEIPAYNIWEGAYRLKQTLPYWPAGTVFVSVVDPGVGSARRSVVVKTKSNHFVVTPDNGTITLLASDPGIAEVRLIDEKVNRLKNSGESYTFHGRDVYAYTGARLAARMITFEQVGPKVDEPVLIQYQQAVLRGDSISGTIDVLDVQYGNVWTNIGSELVKKLGITAGKNLFVTIYQSDRKVLEDEIVFGNTFADVSEGQPVAYLNSLMNLSFALHQDNFAAKRGVGSGPGWRVTVSRRPD